MTKVRFAFDHGGALRSLFFFACFCFCLRNLRSWGKIKQDDSTYVQFLLFPSSDAIRVCVPLGALISMPVWLSSVGPAWVLSRSCANSMFWDHGYTPWTMLSHLPSEFLQWIDFPHWWIRRLTRLGRERALRIFRFFLVMISGASRLNRPGGALSWVTQRDLMRNMLFPSCCLLLGQVALISRFWVLSEPES